MRMRRLILVAAAFAVVAAGSPARADIVAQVSRSTPVFSHIYIEATNLVTGAVVTHEATAPESQLDAGDLVLTELGHLGVVPAGKCRPGGMSIEVTIEAQNVLRQTLLKFHTDTEYWWDCKKVTSVPYVVVYGSDYDYFWRWDRLIAAEKHGVGTKKATVIGAAAFEQCMNYGFGDACLNHAEYKVVFHLFGNGSFDAKWGGG